MSYIFINVIISGLQDKLQTKSNLHISIPQSCLKRFTLRWVTLYVIISCLIFILFFLGMSPNSGNDSEKPRMSYAQLIAEALVNAPDGMLTLSEIYNAISARHPYYKMEARNWQNSIRHNLTLNKSFTKVPRMSSSEGRGSYWKLEPGAESIIFKRSARNVNKSTTSSANTSLVNTSLNLSGGITEVTTANLVTSPQTVQIVQQPVSDASNNVIYVTMSTS